jgi:K+/H+ antiporter YhaU regulatory subunit KhtT
VEIDIEEVVVSPTSWLVGKTLGEAQTTLRSGAIIVALKEPRGLILNQRSEAQVQAGDTLIIVGTSDQLAAFQHHNTAHPSS